MSKNFQYDSRSELEDVKDAGKYLAARARRLRSDEVLSEAWLKRAQLEMAIQKREAYVERSLQWFISFQRPREKRFMLRLNVFRVLPAEPLCVGDVYFVNPKSRALLNPLVKDVTGRDAQETQQALHAIVIDHLLRNGFTRNHIKEVP